MFVVSTAGVVTPHPSPTRECWYHQTFINIFTNVHIWLAIIVQFWQALKLASLPQYQGAVSQYVITEAQKDELQQVGSSEVEYH